MDLTAGKGRKVKQISKKKIKRRRTQGKFRSTRFTCTRFGSCGLHHRRTAGAVPCRRLLPYLRAPPCRRALPCRSILPCRRTLPWRRSRTRWHVEGGIRTLLVGLLCSYTSQWSDISKQRVSMRAQQRETNHILTLGAALGAALKNSRRVR